MRDKIIKGPRNMSQEELVREVERLNVNLATPVRGWEDRVDDKPVDYEAEIRRVAKEFYGAEINDQDWSILEMIQMCCSARLERYKKAQTSLPIPSASVTPASEPETSKCKWCREGNVPQWSPHAHCFIHRRETLDKKCESQFSWNTPTSESAYNPETNKVSPPHYLVPSKDAEKFIRDRWMGDLGCIPFGKVVEFMQSFAESALSERSTRMEKALNAMAPMFRTFIEEVESVGGRQAGAWTVYNDAIAALGGKS